MKLIRIAISCLLLSGAAVLAAPSPKADKANKENNGNPKDQAELKHELDKTPRAELPAKAAEAVAKAQGSDKETVAEVLVGLIAENRASSLPPVVASIAAVAPEVAATAAAEAAKASPNQAAAVTTAAVDAAPAYADAIVSAVATQVRVIHPRVQNSNSSSRRESRSITTANPEVQRTPPPKDPPPNRPVTTPGNINGRRPAIPPGLIRDPKPGAGGPGNYGSP